MNQLKRCPFCKFSQVSVDPFDQVDDTIKYRTGCGSCGTHTPFYENEIDAIKHWNLRVKKDHTNSCPCCNQKNSIIEYKINPKSSHFFYKYECSNCSFASGTSKSKDDIYNLWNENFEYFGILKIMNPNIKDHSEFNHILYKNKKYLITNDIYQYIKVDKNETKHLLEYNINFSTSFMGKTNNCEYPIIMLNNFKLFES